MTQEYPIRQKEDYEIHKPSMENGLTPDYNYQQTVQEEPEYLVNKEEPVETEQLPLEHFQNQTILQQFKNEEL